MPTIRFHLRRRETAIDADPDQTLRGNDIALDAVLLAKVAGGRPVRAQWSRHGEMSHAPFGAVMAVELEAAHGPVTAAIANAVSGGLGGRVRDLPITRERLIAAMELAT